jgi:hypothetical protein
MLKLVYIIYALVSRLFCYHKIVKQAYLHVYVDFLSYKQKIFCSLNIISCSHDLLFCSHRKDILFPQERYFVPTRKIFCSFNILFCSHNISSWDWHTKMEGGGRSHKMCSIPPHIRLNVQSQEPHRH